MWASTKIGILITYGFMGRKEETALPKSFCVLEKIKKEEYIKMSNNPVTVMAIGMIAITIGFCLVMGIIYFIDQSQHSFVPISDDKISYRTVEPTGTLGTAQYFIFDKNGNRYRLNQDVWDKLTDVPRK